MFRSFPSSVIADVPVSSTRSFRPAVRVLGSLALFALAGCAEVPLSPEATGDVNQNVSQADEPSGADEANAPGAECEHGGGKGHGKGHHGFRGHGPNDLIHAALTDLDLTAEQRTAIEALRSGTRPKHDGASPHGAYNTALAAQVRAGSIDRAALSAQRSALEAEKSGWKASYTTALNGLHEALTPEQRTQLAHAQLARHAEHDAKHAEGPGGAEGSRGHRGRHGGFDKRHGHFGPERMLQGIELTDAQRAKLDSLRDAKAGAESGSDRAAERDARFASMKEGMTTFLTAFKADTFDAATSLPEPSHKEGGARHFERQLEVLAALVPELTVEQRATLAERLEQGSRRRHGHRGGPGGRGDEAPNTGEAPSDSQ